MLERFAHLQGGRYFPESLREQIIERIDYVFCDFIYGLLFSFWTLKELDQRLDLLSFGCRVTSPP
jgi:hypothetical protein